MKQFLTAFAAFLATATTSAPAERAFKLETSFTDAEVVFLSIEEGNPVTLKLPRTFPPDDMCVDCDGWQLKNDAVVYDDFEIVPIVVGKRTKFVLTATSSSVVEGQLVEFENTCNVDMGGNILETANILVAVFPHRPE